MAMNYQIVGKNLCKLRNLSKKSGKLVARLTETLPIDTQIGATVASLNQAREQMEGKNLADLQDDYHKLAKDFYSAKIAGWTK